MAYVGGADEDDHERISSESRHPRGPGIPASADGSIFLWRRRRSPSRLRCSRPLIRYVSQPDERFPPFSRPSPLLKNFFISLLAAGLCFCAGNPSAAALAREAHKAQNHGQVVRAYLLFAEAA